MHAATSTCALSPTAVTYVLRNLHPEGRTRHDCTAYQVQCGSPCIYVYTYNAIVHTCGMIMSLPFAFTPTALCTTEHNAHPHARRAIR